MVQNLLSEDFTKPRFQISHPRHDGSKEAQIPVAKKISSASSRSTEEGISHLIAAILEDVPSKPKGNVLVLSQLKI